MNYKKHMILKRYRESVDKLDALGDELEKLNKIAIQFKGTETEPKVKEIIAVANKSADEAKNIRKKLEFAINAIPDSSQRLAMRYLYINGFTVSGTAARLGYVDRQVRRLRNAGLESIKFD